MTDRPSTHAHVDRAGLVASSGVLLPGVAHLAVLQAGYLLVPWVCGRGHVAWLYLTFVLGIALAIGGGLIGWRTWRRRDRRAPGEEAGTAARDRLLGLLGVMSGGLFSLIMLMQLVATLILSPCQ